MKRLSGRQEKKKKKTTPQMVWRQVKKEEKKSGREGLPTSGVGKKMMEKRR